MAEVSPKEAFPRAWEQGAEKGPLNTVQGDGVKFSLPDQARWRQWEASRASEGYVFVGRLHWPGLSS
ncbi:MAG: hypothetical protein VKO39_10985 [Cyanobacteriota bacterium]|nr:hypothetical protein [Cyanobacteriota bacterium]